MVIDPGVNGRAKPSEPVCQFYTKAAPVLLDDVLGMEVRGGVRESSVEDVVNAGGELEVPDEVLAKERQVEDAVTGCILTLDGDGLAVEVCRVVE